MGIGQDAQDFKLVFRFIIISSKDDPSTARSNLPTWAFVWTCDDTELTLMATYFEAKLGNIGFGF